MTVYAIRHPKRGKAHREERTRTEWWWLVSLTTCGLGVADPVRFPLSDVPPDDLCKTCWKEQTR